MAIRDNALYFNDLQGTQKKFCVPCKSLKYQLFTFTSDAPVGSKKSHPRGGWLGYRVGVGLADGDLLNFAVLTHDVDTGDQFVGVRAYLYTVQVVDLYIEQAVQQTIDIVAGCVLDV